MRSLKKMQAANDGTRSLFESVMAPEVLKALSSWKTASGSGVLIGGLALSYYIKPRYTQNVDILFLTDKEIPETVNGFKRTRTHAFQHNSTHVEIEAVTSDLVPTPLATIIKVIDTAIESDGFKVASPAGLIAMKLFRLSYIDKADIIGLINYAVSRGNPIDVSGFSLPQDRIEKFVALVDEANSGII